MTVKQFAVFFWAAIQFRKVSYFKEQHERGLVLCPECQGFNPHCPVCHGRQFVAEHIVKGIP